MAVMTVKTADGPLGLANNAGVTVSAVLGQGAVVEAQKRSRPRSTGLAFGSFADAVGIRSSVQGKTTVGLEY